MEKKENPERFWKLFKYIGGSLGVPFLIYQFYKFTNYSKDTLQDKVVLITGASSGIGEAIAHRFYREGCKLILSARRIDELQRVKNDLLQLRIPEVTTHEPMILQMDLNNLNSFPDHVAKILNEYGCIDILVNNGGISYRGTAANTDVEVDIKIMTVNYFAQIALTKAILPHMIGRRSGHIVYMNSIQGKVGLPRRSAYAASKHALQGFCDSLRAEVQRFNIKISAICPSYVTTSLSFNALTEKGDINKENDLKDGLSPEAVAGELLDAVKSKKNEVILGPFFHRLFAIYRTVFLPAYFKILSKFEDDYVKKETKNN